MVGRGFKTSCIGHCDEEESHSHMPCFTPSLKVKIWKLLIRHLTLVSSYPNATIEHPRLTPEQRQQLARPGTYLLSCLPPFWVPNTKSKFVTRAEL